MTDARPLLVAVPNARLAATLADTGAEVIRWQLGDEPLDRQIDLLVPGYMNALERMDALRHTDVRVVQGQSLGYDNVTGKVPEDVVFCNAVGVHEGATAELAVGLILAAQRGIDDFARQQPDGRWEPGEPRRGLQEARVLLVGAGGVNEQVRARLAPFGVDLVRLARTRRHDEHGEILALGDDLHRELGLADVVVVGLPLVEGEDGTRGFVDEGFLSAMREGALLVNVSRGPIADTDALVRHVRAGHVRVALDVTDPEPLPSTHPLWALPGVLISPHVGGAVQTLPGRITRLVRAQIERLDRGEAPAHIVIGDWSRVRPRA